MCFLDRYLWEIPNLNKLWPSLENLAKFSQPFHRILNFLNLRFWGLRCVCLLSDTLHADHVRTQCRRVLHTICIHKTRKTKKRRKRSTLLAQPYRDWWVIRKKKQSPSLGTKEPTANKIMPLPLTRRETRQEKIIKVTVNKWCYASRRVGSVFGSTLTLTIAHLQLGSFVIDR